MGSEREIELTEEAVPLDGIEDAASDLIRMHGGEVRAVTAGRIDFVLPERRGVAAAGGIGCTLSWIGESEGEGRVTISADRDIEAPKLQRLALLTVGSLGALLWLLWPFFPEYAALAWIGGAVAFATYFLSLRRNHGGAVASLLKHLAAVQRQSP
ncbi:MAG TPA: hypothetical protein VMT00_13875 [Thermoanaerobaculia bacterium]|nr:hypothetical protein [Thermoanaerobaculia bacterium]